MKNNLLAFADSLDNWIVPQFEDYVFLTGAPRRIGDVALIRTENGILVRVQLHLATRFDGVRTWWLVQVGQPPARAVRGFGLFN